MNRKFDAKASTHGAAALGLVILFALASIVTLSGLFVSHEMWGVCLSILGFTYVAAMWFFGSNASQRLRNVFDLQASSQGAAGGTLGSIFICAGFLAFFKMWDSLVAVGICFAIISLATFLGMLYFGIRSAVAQQ